MIIMRYCIRITQLSVVVLCLPLGCLAPPVAILRYWGYYVAPGTLPHRIAPKI